MKRALEIGIFLAIAALSVACSEEERPSRARPRPSTIEPSAPSSRPEYEVVDVDDAGSIAGYVRFVGPVPELEALPVRVHEDLCGPSQPSLALRVSARGGVASAVVSLLHVESGVAIPIPEEPPVIAVSRCRFEPHVLALGVGASVVFENRDAALYNVHALREGETVWDFALPERGSTERRTVDVAGAVHVLSDVGSWMESWVHAFPHPYFAVTDADDGHYRILDVPPGQYVMRVWHEGWRVVGTRAGRPQYSRPVVLTRTISVSPRQETSADFELSAESGELAGE